MMIVRIPANPIGRHEGLKCFEKIFDHKDKSYFVNIVTSKHFIESFINAVATSESAAYTFCISMIMEREDFF